MVQKDTKLKKNEVGKTFGAVATNIVRGIGDEEYNTVLKGTSGIEVYDRMRRQDAKVRATYNILALPILAGNYIIEPGGDSKEDIEAKEFIEEALFERINFHLFWQEACKVHLYGVYPFEKIFEIDDNSTIWWKEFSTRHPRYIYSWETEDGDPGMTQILPNFVEGEEAKGALRSIPWAKLIHFVYDMEGCDYWGISPFRSAYKHWYFKDNIYKLQAVGVERFLVGTPVLKLAGLKEGSPEYIKAFEMVVEYHSNERAGLVLDKEWEFEVFQSKSSGESDIAKFAIEHHDKQLSMNVLAPFLDLGQSGQGSFALSKTQGSFFLLQEVNNAKNMTNAMNPHIQELLELNGFKLKKYPKLVATKIEQIDPKVMADTLSTLLNSNLLDIDVKIKEHLRSVLSLPNFDYSDEDREAEALERELNNLSKVIDQQVSTESVAEEPEENK